MPESESLVESPGIRPHVEPFEDEDPAPSPRVAPPVREGLPPGFRMRADAHYVDQLDTRMSSIPVRLIDTQSIEATHQNGGDAISAAFIDSVKKFGILQPLLVSARGTRYRIIAGRRRLAAAAAAGLREVPCLVQHVDEEQAEQMALVSNLPAIRPRPATPVTAAPSAAGAAAAELSQALAALATCADLIASGSPLSQAAAADLVRAEAARAMGTLEAMRVLRDEMPISRVRAGAGSILELVASHAAAAPQSDIYVEAPQRSDSVTILGDPRLLAEALSSLAAVGASLGELTAPRGSARHQPPPVVVRVSEEDGAIAFTVTQSSVELPAAWLARPFDIPWPVQTGTSSLVRLQAARRIAQAHGGDLRIEATMSGTAFTMLVPAGA